MKIRHVIGERPAGIPEDWIICNAPRPIRGTVTAAGAFITGLFYAGIAPDDPNRDWLIMYNTTQDAYQIIYHTEEEVIDIAFEYWSVRYPDAEIDKVGWRKELRARGIDLLNGA